MSDSLGTTGEAGAGSDGAPILSQPSQPDEGLLGLVMIVRDEASRIGPALAHYASIVDDVTILDTGSADGTQDLVRRAFDHGLRGRLHEEPFVDFATSRNRALDLHGRRTTFTLTANVDRIDGGAALRAFLAERVTGHDHEGAYRVRLRPGCYHQTVVLRAASGWRYVGRTHEVAIGDRLGPGVGPIVPDVSLVVDRAARTPEAWRRRWLRDVDLLQRDLAEHPDDARTVFYLAQTHECLGDLPAAHALYLRRSRMVGYRDETYEAAFRRGRVLDRQGSDEADGAYLEAYAMDPRRAEPLHALALRHLRCQRYALAYLYARRAVELPHPSTDLFVDEDVYAWGARDLVAASAFYLRDADPTAFGVGLACAELAHRARPDDPRLAANLAHYRDVVARLQDSADSMGRSGDPTEEGPG